MNQAITNLANKKAKTFLGRGAEGLYFIIPAEDVKINELLEGIDLVNTAVHFEFQFLSAAYIKSIVDFAGDSIDNIYFNIDLVGNLARAGNWFFNLEKDHQELNKILGSQNGNLLSVDVSLYQNAGANMVQQLAYGLAHANEHLNVIAIRQQAEKQSVAMTFKVSVGTNYFFEINN